MIDACGVSVGFPLSVVLVNRPHMRSKMSNESDVRDCLAREAKILRHHGTLADFYEHFRKRRRDLIAAGVWDSEASIAKHHNNRAAKAGVPGTLTGDDVRRVFATFGRVCLCCGDTDDIAIDHVVSMSCGGHNVFANLQPLCRPCNSRKRAASTDYRTK